LHRPRSGESDAFGVEDAKATAVALDVAAIGFR
jgi:hypothetical protein